MAEQPNLTPFGLNLDSAAEVSGLSKRAIQYSIASGDLIAHYWGNKPVIRVADLEAYLEWLPTVPTRLKP